MCVCVPGQDLGALVHAEQDIYHRPASPAPALTLTLSSEHYKNDTFLQVMRCKCFVSYLGLWQLSTLVLWSSLIISWSWRDAVVQRVLGNEMDFWNFLRGETLGCSLCIFQMGHTVQPGMLVKASGASATHSRRDWGQPSFSMPSTFSSFHCGSVQWHLDINSASDTLVLQVRTSWPTAKSSSV